MKGILKKAITSICVVLILFNCFHLLFNELYADEEKPTADDVINDDIAARIYGFIWG